MIGTKPGSMLPPHEMFTREASIGTLKVTVGTCSTWSLSQPSGPWAHSQVMGAKVSEKLCYLWLQKLGHMGASRELPTAAAATSGTAGWCLVSSSSYSPPSSTTWTPVFSGAQASWERAPFLTPVWRKLPTKSQPTARATCPWKFVGGILPS